MWISKGAVLQIVNVNTQSKVAGWIFGDVSRDHSIRITCVEEISRGNDKLPLLAVGLQSSIGGYVCIFDIVTSKVVRTIELKNNVSIIINCRWNFLLLLWQVTSLHVVKTEHGSVPLPGPLRAFDGILAIGIRRGDVFLVDLCCDVIDEGTF